jgi:hypothetical protein
MCDGDRHVDDAASAFANAHSDGISDIEANRLNNGLDIRIGRLSRP